MDFSKFKPSTWLMVGGGLGMLIFGLFLDWGKVSIDMGEMGFKGMGTISESGGNAFDWTRGWISWFLVVAIGVVALVTVIGKMPKVKVGLPMLIVIAGGISSILLLTMVLFGPEKHVDAAIGLYLSTASALAATAGAVMNLKETGGSIGDLADPNKLKGAFGQGGN